MAEIYFYKDKDGNQPVKAFLSKLSLKLDKNSRIQYNKTIDYIRALKK